MEFRPDGVRLKTGTLWMSGLDSARGATAEPNDAAELLERAAAGDSSAFDQIVTRHERRVLTLAWRLLGNLQDAEDAAQETFLRAFKYRHRCDTRKPIEGWLVGITINVCRDLGSNRKRRQHTPAEAGNAASSVDLHSELELNERREMLRHALKSLPERERVALILRDIEGFSTPEVAETLGFAESTVRSQISRALVKIKKAIHRMKGGRT